MLLTRSTDRAAAFRALSRLQYSTHVVPDTRTSASQTSESVSTAETHAAGPLPRQSPGQGSPTSPSIDADSLRGRLKDWGHLATSSLRRRADQFSKNTTTTFSQLGLHLNRVTGYEEIEALKRQVVAQEARIKATRRIAREAKAAYDDAVLQRAISQRRVNDLLQRKSSWTEADVSDFTSLVRSDHSFEQAESRAKARVSETEDAADREFSELMKVILARYHEEQVWSDKIRSASTYGSLAVLGVNLVVFIMAIIVVEPWKRRRLAQTFEKKVEEMGVETKALMDAGAVRIEERLIVHEKLMTELVTQAHTEARQESLAARRKEESPEETPFLPSPAPSWWSQVYVSYPYIGVVQGRELALVVGGAAAGGLIALITRSIFH